MKDRASRDLTRTNLRTQRRWQDPECAECKSSASLNFSLNSWVGASTQHVVSQVLRHKDRYLKDGSASSHYYPTPQTCSAATVFTDT